MDLLKQFDATAVLLWVVPGAFIALFRSFAIRGNFPPVGKDDVAALLLGSVVYYFVIRLCTTGIEPTGTLSAPVYSGSTGSPSSSSSRRSPACCSVFWRRATP